MRTIGFSLMVGSALFFTLATLQPGYAMSFGKHNNGNGPANQSITQGNGNGNGNGNSNRNGNTSVASFDALPYQVPVPEPSTVVLLASGVLGIGLWRWKKQS